MCWLTSGRAECQLWMTIKYFFLFHTIAYYMVTGSLVRNVLSGIRKKISNALPFL
jgi:hypothetical protein